MLITDKVGERMNGNVLIVDDSMVDRSIMSMIIQKKNSNINVFESEDGLNIKSVILENDIKVCILDLKMPGKDGYAILKELKEDKEVMDIPVIVCTGILDTSSIEKVLTLGAYDYFSKPLSEEAMKISLPLKVHNAIELMKRTQHIVHMSQIDWLTGLYNRNFFKNYLLEYQNGSEDSNAIIMGDINGLKLANDAFGSDFGDQYLMDASQIIQKICPSDAICSRWGGDEFAIFMPQINKKEASAYAGQIKKAFSQINKRGLNLSMAFGLDIQIRSDQDLLKVLSNAEDAMFRDKILEDVSVRSSMIVTILHTLHEKNPREEAHSRRVSELCQHMGEVMNLSEKDIHDLKVIGLLHDIGKIAIDEHILNKPGHLEHEEWLEMKRHPEIGYRIISSSSELQDYADAILCHHERLDGKGYPNGLSHNAIPLYARLLSIIDSYDAMTCERTYKKTMTDVEAAYEFEKNAGSQFDAELAEIFVTKILGLSFCKQQN